MTRRMISSGVIADVRRGRVRASGARHPKVTHTSPLRARYSRSASDTSRRHARSEEHTSELQSLMRISYAVFCLKKKTTDITIFPPHSQPKNPYIHQVTNT